MKKIFIICFLEANRNFNLYFLVLQKNQIQKFSFAQKKIKFKNKTNPQEQCASTRTAAAPLPPRPARTAARKSAPSAPASSRPAPRSAPRTAASSAATKQPRKTKKMVACQSKKKKDRKIEKNRVKKKNLFFLFLFFFFFFFFRTVFLFSFLSFFKTFVSRNFSFKKLKKIEK